MVMRADMLTSLALVPGVEELLDVDREFRESGQGLLHTIRGDRRYTALFSPSALAFRMGRACDWVTIDLEVPGPNLRWTVVSEWRGPMKGKRVVRGREMDCFQFYHAARSQRRGPGRVRAAG